MRVGGTRCSARRVGGAGRRGVGIAAVGRRCICFCLGRVQVEGVMGGLEIEGSMRKTFGKLDLVYN